MLVAPRWFVHLAEKLNHICLWFSSDNDSWPQERTEMISALVPREHSHHQSQPKADNILGRGKVDGLYDKIIYKLLKLKHLAAF